MLNATFLQKINSLQFVHWSHHWDRDLRNPNSVNKIYNKNYLKNDSRCAQFTGYNYHVKRGFAIEKISLLWLSGRYLATTAGFTNQVYQYFAQERLTVFLVFTQAVADKPQDFRERLIISSSSIQSQIQEILITAF